MDTLEEVSAIEDVESEVEGRLDVFVRAYVSEFEKKLEEYAKEGEVGGTAKTGKIADKVVGPVVGALGAAAGASAGVLVSVSAGAVASPLALGRVGASIGKGVGEKIIATGSKFFSGKDHRKKAKKITQIFQTVKPDGLRKIFVEAGSVIYYSFQTQLESVTDADGNWKRALSKLAIDARNRSISYLYKEEKNLATERISKDLLTKALVLGESKESFISHVTPKKMRQIIPGTKPGHTLKNESKEWKTSDIYEKVGIKIVGSNGQIKYYKKKMCGNDYGYRWAFNWENDSSRISKYVEDCRKVSEDPRASLKLEELEPKTVQILANINKEDPKFQLTSIKDGVDESKEALERIQQDLLDIKTKLSSELPNSDQPKIFTVKEPVKTFTGRERELTQLHDKLQTQQNQVVVSQCASISGLGGVGKSELARKYAHTYHESYGSCIWIDSETQSSTIDSFHRLAYDLQILKKHPDSGGTKSTEKDLPFILTQIYKCFSNTRTLFIFDNVNEYDEIRDYLPSNLPPTDEKPTIIITSRNSDWDIGDEGDVGLILLDQFTPEEALSFVKKVLEIKDEEKSHDSSISELTEELCCFPLALRQAASYIKAKKRLNSAIENYLVEFRDDKKKRDLLKNKTKRDRYTETTYTTWQITFRNIEKNNASGRLAIRLVEIMAYLAADYIPLKGFIELAENKDKLKKAVDILVKYSIITVKETYEESVEGNCFYVNTANIHRLVQQVIRLWIQDQEREKDVLGMALIKVHGFIDGHHAAALWSFACNYTTLIDNYFCKMYEETKFYHQFLCVLDYLVENGDVRTIRKFFDSLEGRNDLWREISYHISSKCSFKFSHNDATVENTGHETHIKAVVLFHAEVHKALKHSNTKDLELFLQNFGKSLINSRYNNRTVLERSARCGKLNVVKILVENGADVNLGTDFHKIYLTAVHEALAGEHLKVVEYLLDHGAQFNTTNTILEYVCHKGYLNIVKRLVDTIAKNENGSEVYWIPLHYAVHNNQVEIVKFLTNHEVYRSAMNGHGQTVCSIAVNSGSIQVVKYLIDNKLANINGRDSENKTLLMAAVNNDQFDIVKYLLSDETPDEVDINACNILGSTPLFQAVLLSNMEIARFLIEHGAAVDNVQNGNTLLGQLNISVLHLAAACNCLEIVKLLVEECNADINMGLNTTFSPLQVAKYFDSEEVCEFLVRNGANTSEWCEANLQNITSIFRSFCEGDKKTNIVDCMFDKHFLFLNNLVKSRRLNHNYSEDVKKRFQISFSYLEKLELDIRSEQGEECQDIEKH